jgi:hypothetical protein
MTLESVVEKLDTRRKGGGLLEKVVGDLGVSSGLVNVGADENDPHLRLQGLPRINLFA